MASTSGRRVVVPLTNRSGGGVIAGDVVIVDTTNDESFTTSTAGAVTGGVGIAQESIANLAVGRVLVHGYAALVNVNALVTRGNYGKTHTVAKQAVDAGASRVAGAFVQFLTGGTTPTARVFSPDLGAAAGNVAADAIWDAAGDLAVGTGADTAARLAIGAAGGAVSRINGAVAWNSGVSFPASKATGDRYWRTDLGMEFYWDGTRWLCTCPHIHSFGNQQAVAPWSATTGLRTSHPSLTLDIWAIDFWASTYTTTTSSATQYWTIAFDGTGVTLSTISNAANALVLESGALNQVLPVAAPTWLTLTITKVSTPGTLYADPVFSFRYIAT